MFRTKPGEGRALIEDWINRPSLRKLVEAFDGTWPEGELEHVVAKLVDFSEIWDYRRGTESRLMFHDDVDRPDPFEELTYQASDDLGLSSPAAPSDNSYDYLLILGGLATGVEPRVRYAASLIDGGLNVRHQVAGLGSYRTLLDRELAISRRYAPAGVYEIDHLVAMMASHFPDLKEPTGQTGSSQEPVVLPLFRGVPGTTPDYLAYSAVGQAPASRPANTAETYEFFLGANAAEAGQTVLLITSAIYVPYQHLDAVRVLGAAGLEVETAGSRATAARRHAPRAYRQEIRSTLRSAQLCLRSSQADGFD